VGFILALAAILTAVRWLKLGTFWGDASLWLFEVYRASNGELAYADFMWMYPPLSLWLFAGAFRAFGATFATAQVVLSILGTLLLLLTWDVSRRLFGSWIALIVTVVLAFIGATSGSDLALFSLRIYTPAILLGTIGNLLMALAALEYVRPGPPPRGAYLGLAVGSTVALLSKHEAAAGAVVTLVAVIALDLVIRFGRREWARWIGRSIVLAAITMLPAVAAYAATAAVTGWPEFVASMTGYGMAAAACPLWPTGIGVFGALAGLGQGLGIVALASVFETVLRRGRPSRPQLVLWGVGLLGFVVLAAYVPFAKDNYPPNALPLIGPGGSYVLSIRGFFFPAMWWSVVVGLAMSFRFLARAVRGHAVSVRDGREYVVVALAASLCARSLFGGFANLSTTPVSAVPFLLISGMVIGFRWLRVAEPGPRRLGSELIDRRTWASLVVILAGYGGLRLAGGLAAARGNDYQRLTTRSGDVVLYDGNLAAEVYRYVIANSRPGDYVLDIPYGGGVNFAARQRSPIYSTLLVGQAPPPDILKRDRDGLAAQRPPLVIVPDMPLFGVQYGVNAKVGCTFPRLAWEFEGVARNTAIRLPVIQYIEEEYVPRARIQHLILLEPRTR
jgi:hypothetical protein